jgi:DNA-binding transcriptional ArsR family regulator
MSYDVPPSFAEPVKAMQEEETDWTFFSPYAHVLICLADKPRIRLREVAGRVGVTERTAMRLIDRLVRAGVVRRRREGRRTVYEIVARGSLPHPIESRCSLKNLLRAALGSEPDRERDN